jgi:hypothetical protein
MGDFKAWLKLNEVPHGTFRHGFPPGFEFMSGINPTEMIFDFGFENFGLEPPDYKKLLFQYNMGNGVRIPGTKLKVKYGPVTEPADGSEPELPSYWREAVLIMDENGKPVFIGKRVRPDQTGTVDYKNFQDIGIGWMLKQQPAPEIGAMTHVPNLAGVH